MRNFAVVQKLSRKNRFSDNWHQFSRESAMELFSMKVKPPNWVLGPTLLIKVRASKKAHDHDHVPHTLQFGYAGRIKKILKNFKRHRKGKDQKWKDL